MSQFNSSQNQDLMQLLQQQLLNRPNPFGQISIPNATEERILPQNFQLSLTATIQSFPQYLNQSQNYPSQINPSHVSQFLPEQVFSQECATNYQHSSGLTSLDPTEEKILFGSDDDVSSSAWVISQGNAETQDGCLGNFSSINSGSWSALMQTAVEASSSETGLHEEWSSLSFQKPEESISNNSSILATNQPLDCIVNEGHAWNIPYAGVSGNQNLFNESAHYSSGISEDLDFAKNKEKKGIKKDLGDQPTFQSNCFDGASIDPLANLYSVGIASQTSQSMLKPNCKAERATSNATAPRGIPISATADSSTSHEMSTLMQISLQNQFISNQPLSHYQYPSVHLSPKQPQKDHYISQSNIVDSKKTIYPQDTFYDLFGSTKMVCDIINNPSKSVTESSLGSMVSTDPIKLIPNMFQSNMEGDKLLTGSAKYATYSLDQDRKQDVFDEAKVTSFSSEAKNLKEYSHFCGNTGSVSRSVQGNTCLKDTTLKFGPKSPKRGCDAGPHDVRQRRKKQKGDRPALVSWFRVVNTPHQRFYNVRIKEHEWTRATNRLIDKVEDIAKSNEDVPSEAQNRKRLNLTTLLTGQLFPALQFKYLKEDASLAYRGITYRVARSVLEEACTLISSTDNSSFHSDPAERIEQEFSDISAGGSSLPKAVENIMQKSNILESYLLRLDKMSSVVDMKLMWQELERFAIVSCLGKFHAQSRHVNPEDTPNSQTTPQRRLVRKHATLVVLQIDTALNGVSCLSL